jgi:O-acetyl-ADP-ribose deacetylase (regulator of RNase III)
MPEDAESVPEHRDLISLADIVADLRLLRQRGLVHIRHSELSALGRAVGQTRVVAAADTGPRAVEVLLRAAVENLGDGPLGSAATHTFGLNRGARDRPAQDRRRRAAQEYGVSVERFRKYHERIIIEQVAEEILKLCPPVVASSRPDPGPPELAAETRLEGHAGNTPFPVVVHVEPVELLRDVDVIVSPANLYLEMSQPYKVSVSAAIRRASARRAPDGAVTASTVTDELRSWINEHGRPGLPVTAGTVAATSSGDLIRHGIRRIYHAAIASPRLGTNDYDIEPTCVAQAVHAVFATARSERETFRPRLNSLGFPLLGAGRGGLDPATSFAWMWAALEREMRGGDIWEIHFITRQRSTADVILAGLTSMDLGR